MPDYVALRLRLSVRSACVSAQRRRNRSGRRLPPGQAALVGGLALAAAWTGGSAVAQVVELARDGLIQPAVLIAPAKPPMVDSAALAATAAQAAQRREALGALVGTLRTAAGEQGAPLQAAPVGLEVSRVPFALDAIERVVDARAGQLGHVLRTLGIRPASLMTVSAGAIPPGVTLASNPKSVATDAGLDEASALRLERLASRVADVRTLAAAVARLPIAAPVINPVRSSAFGGRSDPFTGASAFHAGQDFSGARMTPIEATAQGVVSFTGQRSGYGNTVEVDHGGGYKTRYAHLAAIGVRVGQPVAIGDKLGGMGSTGRSTGTHLHYEVWVNGVVQNPERFLRAGLSLGQGGQWARGEQTGRKRLLYSRYERRRGGRVHARFG